MEKLVVKVIKDDMQSFENTGFEHGTADLSRWKIISFSKKFTQINIYTQTINCFDCQFLFTTKLKSASSNEVF